MPELASEAVNPKKTESGADGDGNNPQKHAGLAHALEQFQRWQAPDHVTHFVFAKEALLADEDKAKDARQGEGGVGQNTQRDVQSKSYAARGGGSEAIGGSEMRGKEKNKDERQDESADGALAMINFQGNIRKREKPPEKGHGAVKIVVRNSVKGAGAFEEREIMKGDANNKEGRSKSTDQFPAGMEKLRVEKHADAVRDGRERNKRMSHGSGR